MRGGTWEHKFIYYQPVNPNLNGSKWKFKGIFMAAILPFLSLFVITWFRAERARKLNDGKHNFNGFTFFRETAYMIFEEKFVKKGQKIR